MTPTAFRDWYKSRGWSQREAAAALGIKPRQVSNYANGHAPVPLYIRLAMAAIALGLEDYPS